VQLPRLSEALASPDRPQNDALLRWGRFFAARTAEDLDEAAMSDSAVLEARDVLLQLSADPEVRRLAEIRELAQTTRRIEDTRLLEQGRQQELRQAIFDICEVLDIGLGGDERAQIETLDTEALVTRKHHLKSHRAWPKSSTKPP
jgi:hypothetical protein